MELSWVAGFAVCSVFSGWDGVHVVRFGRSARGGLGELRVVRGSAGRGMGSGHRQSRPGDSLSFPGPSFLPCAGSLGLPEAAVTSQLRTPLSLLQSFPQSPSSRVILAPQRTFSRVWRRCWGYYKWCVRGCCWHLEGGGQGCCSATSNAQPSQQSVSQLQMSVGLRLGNPALGP